MKSALKLFLIFILVFSLAGCATVQSYQTSCENRYSYFPDMVTCLNNSVNWDYRYRFGRNSSLGQAYMKYANKLADCVRHNQISNAQAYYLLNQAYLLLNSKECFHHYIYTVN